MKKIISILLCLVILICYPGVLSFAYDEDIALCNNNVMMTDTLFYISSAGKSEISVSYYGYPGITTGARITTILERDVRGVWRELTRWVENTKTDTYLQVYDPSLPKGTYRIIVEYVISGTGGPDDVITEVITETY